MRVGERRMSFIFREYVLLRVFIRNSGVETFRIKLRYSPRRPMITKFMHLLGIDGLPMNCCSKK